MSDIPLKGPQTDVNTMPGTRACSIAHGITGSKRLVYYNTRIRLNYIKAQLIKIEIDFYMNGDIAIQPVDMSRLEISACVCF